MNATHPPRRLLRSGGAVFAGLLAIVVLSLGTDQVLRVLQVYPPWDQPMSDAMFGLATAYRIVYGVVGGYVTAWLVPHRPLAHALALGIVGLVLSTAGAVVAWNAPPEMGPLWYPLALVVTALPCAWAGGKLYTSRAGS